MGAAVFDSHEYHGSKKKMFKGDMFKVGNGKKFLAGDVTHNLVDTYGRLLALEMSGYAAWV